MAFRRTPKRPTPPVSRVTEFPAPVRGWVSNRNLATNTRDAARVLENWFPTQNSVRVRQGWKEHFAFPVGTTVKSLFAYNSGTFERMFALAGTLIYDVSTPLAVAQSGPPTYLGTQGLDTVQIRTPGGHFLYAVNGQDAPVIYDGGTWQIVGPATSPIALTGVTVTNLVYPFTFKERLFFLEKNKLKAWFLAVKSVGGALSELDLSSVFRRGGKLLMAGSFSSDSGDGLDDRCAFITDQGEVAIYAGTDPGDANAWTLVGIYEIGKPLGPKAWIRAGGDWVIATREGMVPLSAAIQRDPAALSVAAISRAIEPDWVSAVALRGGEWQCVKWDAANLAMVSMAVDAPSSTRPAQVFVVNIETGAWAKWTGPNVSNMTTYANRLFVSAGDEIFEAEGASSDSGEIYLARCSWWPDDLGSATAHKRVALARATFTARTTFTPQVSVSVNYGVSWPSPPGAAAGVGDDTWDAGSWDAAVWSSVGDYYAQTQWVSVGRSGFAVAPQVQISIGGGAEPGIDLIAMETVHEAGGAVV